MLDAQAERSTPAQPSASSASLARSVDAPVDAPLRAALKASPATSKLEPTRQVPAACLMVHVISHAHLLVCSI